MAMASTLVTILPDLLFDRAASDAELLLKMTPISSAFRQAARECWDKRKKEYEEGLESRPPGIMALQNRAKDANGRRPLSSRSTTRSEPVTSAHRQLKGHVASG